MALGGSGSGGSSGGIRAGRAFVEAYWKDDKLRAGLARMKSMFAGVAKLAAAVGAGGALGAVGIGGAIAGLVKAAANDAAGIGKLSAKLGVAVEKLSAFAYAAGTTGVEMAELEGHFENWAERVAQGALGMGEAADEFKRLGIDAAKLKNLDMVDQFIVLADAMRGVTNETERLGLLSAFGGDQFQKLNDLFKQGPAAIRQMMADAERVGAVTTAEQVRQAKEINLAWSNAVLAVKNTVLEIGRSFFGASGGVKSLSDAIVGLSVKAREAIRGGIGGALQWLAEKFGPTIATFKQTWQGVTDAIKGGDLGLALKVAFAGARYELLRLANLIRAEFDDIATGIGNAISGSLRVYLEDAEERFLNFVNNAFDPAARAKESADLDEILAAKLRSAREGRRGSPLKDQLSKEFEREIFRPELAAFNELQALRGQAAGSARDQRVRDAFRGMFGPKGPGLADVAVPQMEEVKRAMGQIRGGFAGFGNLNAQFGGGQATKGIVDQLKKANVEAGKQTSALQELIGLVEDAEGGAVIWGV